MLKEPKRTLYFFFYVAGNIRSTLFYRTVSADFDSLSMDFTFSNATTTQCANISTTFNASMNPTPFSVNISTSEAPTAVSLSPAFTTVTIQIGIYNI